jgi:carboxymethylenebutenolidase
MCHTEKIEFFGELREARPFHEQVQGLRYGPADEHRRVAVLPDIYGLTDFYKGYASYLCSQGAETFLVNPWAPFGELPEMTREAAYERRHKLADREHCDHLQQFLRAENIDVIIGFCIGGNFAFEMARRGYEGTIVAVYPLPWGMANDDQITAAFDYMPSLEKEVNIFMGDADHLAGPDNIEKLKSIVAANSSLQLRLYSGSNHGFFTDLTGDNEALRDNAVDAIDRINRIIYPG